MTTTATEFETDLVDLSRWGLRGVMALEDPLLADALRTLVRGLGTTTAAQNNAGSQGSPYLVVGCGSSGS